MKIKYVLLSLLFLFMEFDSVLAQEIISLSNPSFEDTPHIGGGPNNPGPKQWYNCGFRGETPPDIQPNSDINGTPFFGVTTEAYDGKTYLGMVTRDNETYEAVGQRLERSLLAGTTYAFNLYLAQSNSYTSLGRRGDSFGKPVKYAKPITIRIYGGNSYCEEAQLLAKTKAVDNTDWKDYSLIFTPDESYSFIMIQAFYQMPTLYPYNGNVLVDHLSNIVEVIDEKQLSLLSQGKVRTEGGPLDDVDEERASFKLSLKGSLGYATPREIDSIVVDVVDRLTESDMDIPVKIGIMHEAAQFDQQIRKGGLRQFVLNTPKGELGKMIRCLETMNMTAPLNILKKTALIFNSEKEKTEAEVAYFDNSDELWLETTASESITDLRWKYFQRNKDAIIQEVVDLY